MSAPAYETTAGAGEEVLVEVVGDVLVVTLNRPQARNAVNEDLARGIAAAMERLDADPALWVAPSAVTHSEGTGMRSILARMVSADLVHWKGLGSSLCSLM